MTFKKEIHVTFEDWTNAIEKRYSELQELHNVLKLMKFMINKPIPKFPKQMALKSFFRNLSQEELEERRRDLENYLQEAERGACAKNSKFFSEFFGLPIRLREKWSLGIADG